MKADMNFDTDPVCRPPREGGDLSRMRIECVSFDAQGVARRRRLVSVLAMLRPPRPARASRRRPAQG